MDKLKQFRFDILEKVGDEVDFDNLETFNLEFEADGTCLDIVAGDAADHYHHHCDGWESSSDEWIIALVHPNKDEVLGVFEVEREIVPQFIAREVKP